MSIAGGFPRAVERAVLHGCEALQIFTRSTGQWRARTIPAVEIAAFRQALDASELRAAMSHAPYLINLAAASPPLRHQSLLAFGEELDRAEALGLFGVVLHPGAFTTGNEATGLDLIARGIRSALATRKSQRVMVLLEHTAGQGTSLGHRFEQLASILSVLDGAPRVGVCLDTCHLLAAGYDITSADGYEETLNQFSRIVGLDRLRAWHLNDSKKPLGSRVDRHAHIGEGFIGPSAFRRLLADRRFARVPMVIETEKTPALCGPSVRLDPLDVKNLNVLRGLRGG
jgi:deoxyribonuclease IV